MRNHRVFFTLSLAGALFPLALAQSYLTTTFAGSNRLLDGHAANTVPLRYPWGIVQDAAGNVYFADTADNRIRHIDPTGIITTIAGTGEPGYSGDNGPAAKAQLSGPQGIALDSKGNLFICDYQNEVVRKVILSTGIISTVAWQRTSSTPEMEPPPHLPESIHTISPWTPPAICIYRISTTTGSAR